MNTVYQSNHNYNQLYLIIILIPIVIIIIIIYLRNRKNNKIHEPLTNIYANDNILNNITINRLPMLYKNIDSIYNNDQVIQYIDDVSILFEEQMYDQYFINNDMNETTTENEYLKPVIRYNPYETLTKNKYMEPVN